MSIRYTATETGVSSVIPSCASRDSTVPPAQRPPINVRVSVFFDGTGNNMFNTRARLERSQSLDDSYVNDYSNVAKLAQYLTTVNTSNSFHFPVYVEGMGTLNDETDDTNGMGFGTFDRGIPARVISCTAHIKSRISEICRRTNRHITSLKFDSFGFSRGAAAARHFIYRAVIDTAFNVSLVTQLRTTLFSPITIDNVQFPFVGLFDTVASYRPLGLMGPLGSITNDTRELELDAINRPEVLKVFQIAAGEEHRMNFPLTDVRSAGRKGRQLFLPGVHSDIGGGYNSEGDTREHLLPILEIQPSSSIDIWTIQERYKREMMHLVELGWYEWPINFSTFPNYDPDVPNSYFSDIIRVSRQNIKNNYSRIPLRLMAERAGQGSLLFNSLVHDNCLDDFLTSIYGLVTTGSSDRDYWANNYDPQIKRLRKEYFHFSAHYTPRAGVARPMKPQFYSSVHHFRDTKENILHGIRKRMVLPG